MVGAPRQSEYHEWFEMKAPGPDALSAESLSAKPTWVESLPVWLAGAAAICPLVSVAASEILMGASIVALILTRRRWLIPPIALPFAIFIAWTLLSLFANGHAREGLPQIRKLYVYTMLFLVASAIQTVRQIRWIALGWTAAAALSSAWALNQFYNKVEDARDAHQDFYRSYVADRITGFMDHWLTFSNQMMMVLLIAAAILFFSADRRWTAWRGGPRLDIWIIAAGALISIAIILNETRSVWLATAVAGAYLIWFWKRWVLLAIPVLVAIAMLANPFELRERILSPLRPHGDVDSTAHRALLRSIGWRMIAAHPWIGVGPEEVSRQASRYMPPGELPSTTEYFGHLENDYIQYAAERGLPAMLALMWMIARAFYDFARGLIALRGRTSRSITPQPVTSRPSGSQLMNDSDGAGDAAWVLHGAIASILAMLIAGWFSWNLNTSTVLALFMAILGCGYATLQQLRSN